MNIKYNTEQDMANKNNKTTGMTSEFLCQVCPFFETYKNISFDISKLPKIGGIPSQIPRFFSMENVCGFQKIVSIMFSSKQGKANQGILRSL